jgi:hypothetical protein
MWTVIYRMKVCLRASVLLSRVYNVKLCLFNIATQPEPPQAPISCHCNYFIHNQIRSATQTSHLPSRSPTHRRFNLSSLKAIVHACGSSKDTKRTDFKHWCVVDNIHRVAEFLT